MGGGGDRDGGGISSGGGGGGGGGEEEEEVPPLPAEVTAYRSRVWELMSHALLALGRPAEALHAAETAQREHAGAGPPPLRLRLARAEAMRALGRQPDALQALGAALRPWPPTQTPRPTPTLTLIPTPTPTLTLIPDPDPDPRPRRRRRP